MGHYDEYYDKESHEQEIWNDSLRKTKIQHLKKSVQQELKKLDKELEKNIVESRPTLIEKDRCYFLKDYIDKRFDILLELMVK